MANEQLVIPAGVRFTIQENGVSIEYAGDIVLQGDHDEPVARVVSQEGSVMIQGRMQVGTISSVQGSVTLDGTIEATEVQAGETVTLHGEVQVGTATGREIRVLGGRLKTDELRASENLELRGEVNANKLSGRAVRVAEGSVHAKAIEASYSADLGPASVEVDIIIAPTVSVDPQSTGRVAVLESDNELGPNGLRGAFRLSEFAEFTGQDPDQFLRDRNVRPLDEIRDASPPAQEPAPAPIPAPVPTAAPTPEPVPVAAPPVAPPPVAAPPVAAPPVAAPRPPAPASVPEPAQQPVAAEPTPEPTPIERPPPVQVVVPQEPPPAEEPHANTVYVEDDEAPAVMAQEPEEEAPVEESGAIVSVVEDDEAPQPDAAAAPAEAEEQDADQDPIAKELLETVNLIVECYDETGVPPAVTELHGLISTGEYEEVRSEITNIWNSLLKYHQQTGTRLQHQVTTTFNTINSIVRKMDRAS